MPLFSLTKFLLWTAFAAASTFVLVVRFSPLALALFALVAATTVYWLVRHRLELARRYLKAEEKAAIPGPHDKLLWRSKPRLKDIAPGIALLGLWCFYVADEIARGKEPTRLARVAYDILGMAGGVGFWATVGTVLLALGSESWLGSKSSQ